MIKEVEYIPTSEQDYVNGGMAVVASMPPDIIRQFADYIREGYQLSKKTSQGEHLEVVYEMLQLIYEDSAGQPLPPLELH